MATPLDVADGFDVHDHRDGLKLLTQDAGTWHLANPDDAYACPACGGSFDRLFVSDEAEVTFGSAPNGPICLVRAPERLLVLTHGERA